MIMPPKPKGPMYQERTKDLELEVNYSMKKLMLYRTEFVSLNELYDKEYGEMEAAKKQGGKDLDKKVKAFCDRWHVGESGMCTGMESDPDPIVRSEELDYEHVKITFDIRYPKSKVKKVVSEEIERWYEELAADARWRAELAPLEKRVQGKLPKNLDDLERYLLAWMYKELDYESWAQVAKKLRAEVYTVRNWHRKARKLIKYGVPGLPAFPLE